MTLLRRIRRDVHRQLDPEAWPHKGLSPANAALSLLIFLTVAASIAETEPVVSAGREHLFRAGEIAVGGIFLGEYALRVWTCVESRRWSRKAWPRLRYVLSLPALVDLAAVVPAIFAVAGGSTLVLRLVRVVRIFRLAKLGRVSRAWRGLAQAVVERRSELMIAVGLALVAIVFGATLLYWAEGDVQPDKFGSIPRALWWSVVTVTTVGYGDATPVTPLGKLFSALISITGIMLIALPTGILAAAFSDVLQRQRDRERRSRDRAFRRDADERSP
ncbi:MAG: ion transporter [Alphaproteobacteria bacterium]|nr:ion transporter [Alphaproteobacteria bacterium]